MSNHARQDADIATTLGWDTVFAIHIEQLNEVIALHRSSPSSFDVRDDEDGISVVGTFDDWRVVPGGSGGLVRMDLPFHDTQVTMGGLRNIPVAGVATIELRLRFLDQDADCAPGQRRTLHLTVEPQAASLDEPAVSALGLTYTATPPGGMQRSALETLLDTWLNTNIELFQHVFAAVDVNAAAAHDGFQWLQPTHVDYAYCDFGRNDGLLAILCMTEGRPPAGLAQQVSPAAIPTGQRAGFLISKRRLLEKLLLPAMPGMFPGTRSTDFALSGSGDAIITPARTVSFKVRLEDRSEHHAELDNFQLTLTGDEITFNVLTKVNVSDGVWAWSRAENFLGIRLIDIGPNQTLGFYDSRPQLVTKWAENHKAFEIAETILIVVSLIALAVAAVATAGTALAVGALVIGLLAGAAAGGLLIAKAVIDKIGTDQAPSVGALLLNSTAPISWTGGKVFHLTTAGLSDSLRLGGMLTKSLD